MSQVSCFVSPSHLTSPRAARQVATNNVHRLGKRTARNGEKQNATRPEWRHQERVSRVVGKRAQNTDRDGAAGTSE
jgi:hypothetical protein